ncbi:MAG: hypothetical protein Q9M92_04870 [Enterobacterales bacterium]|nr:hypothetical protein [Enterobacterales bacterium]
MELYNLKMHQNGAKISDEKEICTILVQTEPLVTCNAKVHLGSIKMLASIAFSI